MKTKEQIISIDLIDDEDESLQGRIYYDQEKIDNLSDDIKKYGQRNNIGIRESPKNKKKFQLIYGFQRTKAIKKLKFKEIKATIYLELSEREAEELAVRDNEIHGDLTEIERALQCSKLKEQGWTVEELCKSFNTKKSTIYNWLSITNCDDILKGLIHRGFFTVYHGIEMMREADYSRRLEIMKLAYFKSWSVREIRNYMEKETYSGHLGLFGWFDCYYTREMVAVGYIVEHCKHCKQHTKFGYIESDVSGKKKKYFKEEEYIEDKRLNHGDYETTIKVEEKDVLPIEVKNLLKAYDNREIEKPKPRTKEDVSKFISLLKETLSREDFNELNLKEDGLKKELENQELELERLIKINQEKDEEKENSE